MPAVAHDGGNGGSSRGAATYTGLRSRRPAHALGEINVVPLVDVVLVLLLVFMITAPMMSRGIDVDLPVANQPDIRPEDRVTVAVTRDGRIYLGDQPVNIELLEERLRGTLAGLDRRIVYLRADQGLRYGQVMEVVDRIQRSGVDTIGFVIDLPEEGS